MLALVEVILVDVWLVLKMLVEFNVSETFKLVAVPVVKVKFEIVVVAKVVVARLVVPVAVKLLTTR